MFPCNTAFHHSKDHTTTHAALHPGNTCDWNCPENMSKYIKLLLNAKHLYELASVFDHLIIIFARSLFLFP